MAATDAKDSFAPHPVAFLPQLRPAAGHRFSQGDQFPRPCFQLKSTPTRRAPCLHVSIPNDGQAKMLFELLLAGWQDVWTEGKRKGVGDPGHIPWWTQRPPPSEDTSMVWFRPSEASDITEDPGWKG